MGRELTSDELGILAFAISDAATPGAAELRAQLPHVRVVERLPALPTWVHLAVDPLAPRADLPDGPVPGTVVVGDSTGETTGTVLVWIKDGYLDAIEHAWFTDEMPQRFPSPGNLRMEGR